MKRSKKTIALLLALCIMIGGYLLIQSINNKETVAVNEEVGTFALTDHTQDELVGIHYTVDDTDYNFVAAENGVWQMANNAAFPLNSETVQSMSESLVSLKATRKLTENIVLSDYELDAPSFTVTATWADGTVSTYALGSATPFQDGYYLYIQNDPSVVYTTSESLDSLFTTTMSDLAVKETIPTATNVTRIVISGVLDAEYYEESYDFDPDRHWYDWYTGYSLDSAAVEELIDTANSLVFSNAKYYTPTDEDWVNCELTDDTARHIILFEGDEAVRTIYLGAVSGTSAYCAAIPGSSVIYAMMNTNVDPLFNTSVYELAVQTLMPLTYEGLAEATITAGDIQYTIVTGLETEDEDKIEMDKILWNQVYALAANSMADFKEGETLLTIQATNINGLSRIITISTYDMDNYQVTVDYSDPMLISADSIDRIIRTLKNI